MLYSGVIMRCFLQVCLVSLLFITTLCANASSHSPAFSQKEITTIEHHASDLPQSVLKLALIAYHHAKLDGKVSKPLLTIIDYSRKSNQKRLWVINLKNDQVPFYTYVAHGRGSGTNSATHFSNRSGSHATSLGTYVTGHTYVGHHGLELRLIGLEKGVNDHAMRRAIVMHGAWYMAKSFIHRMGRAGLSWGCPALPMAVAKPLIQTIKNGSLLFAYYPDKYWLAHSHYLG